MSFVRITAVYRRRKITVLWCQEPARNGRSVSSAFGKISSMALDPIEKKPLRRFHPGSQIMSIGSMGCNMRCPFCQNYEISMQEDAAFCVRLQPGIVDIALQQKQLGNIGIAYTYNEPLINFEFVLAVCKLASTRAEKRHCYKWLYTGAEAA